MNDDHIRKDAIEFARANKTEIAKKIANLDKFPSETNPVSVFMAGSPGAGKTEASQALLETSEAFLKRYAEEAAKKFPTVGGRFNCIRIDADDLRNEFSAYSGANSDSFQGAVSILVDCIHDLVLKQSQSFILDGTLANRTKAEQNILRSLKRKRFVQIYYVYQAPQQAWKFVQERERIEGRHIPQESFIDQYFQARETANCLKRKFEHKVRLDILLKNVDGTNRL